MALTAQSFGTALAAWLPALVMGIVLFTAQHLDRAATPKPPVPAIAAAAADYQSTLPATYEAISKKAAAGGYKTRNDALTDLKSHAAPFAKAQDDAIAKTCDANGNITDAAGLASVFNQVASSLKGK